MREVITSRHWAKGAFFLLPFKYLGQGSSEINALLTSAVESILRYRQRNTRYLPEWLKTIQFAAEKKLEARKLEVEAELTALKAETDLWKEYKAILSATGRPLVAAVVSVLRNFFSLNLRSEENYIEDAIIYGDDGALAFVVEIKGVNGGITAQHVNQVDNHRDRLGISPETVGLLVINDFAAVEGCEERKSRQIDKNNLARATNHNVRILRTTILLDLMLATEGTADRARVFMEACVAGNPLVSVPQPPV